MYKFSTHYSAELGCGQDREITATRVCSGFGPATSYFLANERTYRGYRFGLRLRLPVRLIILVLGGPDLDAAFQHSSVLHADTLGDHITR